MKFIVKPRGLGKTTDLVRLSYETGIPILTGYNNKNIYKERCEELGIVYDRIQVYTLEEVLNKMHQGLFTTIYVDEADAIFVQLLQRFGNITPVLGTITLE